MRWYFEGCSQYEPKKEGESRWSTPNRSAMTTYTLHAYNIVLHRPLTVPMSWIFGGHFACFARVSYSTSATKDTCLINTLNAITQTPKKERSIILTARKKTFPLGSESMTLLDWTPDQGLRFESIVMGAFFLVTTSTKCK